MKARCQCLCHLCLVSRAYRECVTPFLYRDIRLNLRMPQCLFSLIATLDSIPTKSLLDPREPSGYGSCTKFIAIDIAQNAMHQSDLAVGIRNLIDRLPGLQLVQIHGSHYVGQAKEISPLSTLTLERVDIAILFDHKPALQVLESLQRLSIGSCYDSTLGRPLRTPLSRIYLPGLLEISLRQSVNLAIINPFTTMSTWEMPRLRSLHVEDNILANYSLLLGFFKLLQTHGSQLQSLALTSRHLQKQDISNVLTLCTDLRSFYIDTPVSIFAFSASHARLEKIKVTHWSLTQGKSDSPMSIAVRTLMILKLKAVMSFPKLIEAELMARGSLMYGHVTGFFRTADAFITFRDDYDKTYRLFDQEAELVGAYFGQGVDCADFVAFGYLSIPEVPS